MLLERASERQRDRNHFDPLNLIDSENPSDANLHRYFNLEDSQFATRYVKVTGSAKFTDSVTASVEKAGAVSAFATSAPLPDEREPAAPRDPEGFFSQLFSTDEIAWRNALEQEAENLAGCRLDDASFRMLINEVNQTPAFVQIDWLEQLEPYLTADQILEIYQQSSLLQRLNNEIKEGHDGSEQK